MVLRVVGPFSPSAIVTTWAVTRVRKRAKVIAAVEKSIRLSTGATCSLWISRSRPLVSRSFFAKRPRCRVRVRVRVRDRVRVRVRVQPRTLTPTPNLTPNLLRLVVEAVLLKPLRDRRPAHLVRVRVRVRVEGEGEG